MPNPSKQEKKETGIVKKEEAEGVAAVAKPEETGKESKSFGRGRGERRGGNRENSGRERAVQDEKKPRNREDRPQRPRFEYPEDWREQAKKDVTLETKVPENPKGEALLAKPDFAKLQAEQSRNRNRIAELKQDREDKIKEKRQHIDEMFNKNKGIIEQIKAKRAEVNSKYFDKISKLKEEREKVFQQKKAISDEIEAIKNKSGAKSFNIENLTKQLRELEEEHETSQLTAHREARLLDQIDKIRVQLNQVGPFEEKIKKRNALEAPLKKLNEELDVLYKKAKPLNEEIDKLRAQLDSNKEEAKKTKEETKTEEGEKKERAPRQKTDLEVKIDGQIDAIQEEKNKLLQKIRDTDQKFNDNMLNFEKQQFEIRKLEEMRKYQAYLRRQEQRKKDEEEYIKSQAERKEKELEYMKFKFSAEISECGNLIKMLEEKLAEKNAKPEEAAPAPAQDAQPKPVIDEDLKPLISKKAEFKEEPRPSKKHQKAKKPVPEASKKLFNDYYILAQFAKYEVIMPNSLPEAETAISALKEKVAGYEKQRAADLEVAEKRLAAQKEAAEKGEELAPAEEDKPAPPKEKRKAPKPITEEDFPTL